MLTIFSGLMTTSLISQTTFAYTINDKTKNLNIITKDSINKNEIKTILVQYLNNVERITQIQELDINYISKKAKMITNLLLIGHLIDEVDTVKNILTTRTELNNILDFDDNILFDLLSETISTEKRYKWFVTREFFLNENNGKIIELIFNNKVNNKASLTINKKHEKMLIKLLSIILNLQ